MRIKTSMIKIVWLWLPVIIYCIFIFYLSSLPRLPVEVPSLPFSDKILHGIEYAILGLLLTRPIFILRPGLSPSALILITVSIATIYGVSDEIHQAFVPGRMPNFWDVMADFFGSYIGTFSYLRIFGSLAR